MPRREILRQLLHLGFGTLFIALILLLGRTISLALIILCFTLGALLSYLVSCRKNIPVISSFLSHVQRDYEHSLPGQGALLFFLATILLLALFPQELIVAGALIVSVYGDGFSTLIGKAFGKTKIGSRSLEGSIAGFVVSAVLLSFFFPLHTSLIVSLSGMLAEFLPVDDNLTIPLVSGFVLSFLL